MIACPKCAQTYSPRGGGHCGCCHRTFTSDGAYNAHRTGSYGKDERRCLTDAEMRDAGWRITPRGLTPYAERQDKDICARCGQWGPVPCNCRDAEANR